MTYRIVALVRKVGAIGIFYPGEFTVEADSRDEAKAEWFRQCTLAWELHHFVRITEKGESS